VLALAEQVGLTVLCTDDTIQANGINWLIEDYNCLRGERCTLLTDPATSPVAAALADGTIAAEPDAPRRLFLSRKDTRKPQNEADIETLLHGHGFTKIYMEDLTPGQQLRYGAEAERIVAVHGAALAPILYRDRQGPPLQLIELFPVGHITNVYRAVLAAQGGEWCGVRGAIQPDSLTDLYRLEHPYLKHSLRDFRVDPVSVELALQMPPAPATSPRDR
jgi:hypothetical protein